jgi:Protein of unknown function (DUF2501)
MQTGRYRTQFTGMLIAALLPFSVAQAQLGDMLKQGGTTGSVEGLGNLGGMGGALSLESLTSSSTGNVAGVLEFCIKNNYLSGNGASSVKNSLMRKLPGGSPSSDKGYSNKGYSDGANGILNSSDGKPLDLSGGGLKKQVTKQVCDKILAQGKSLL